MNNNLSDKHDEINKLRSVYNLTLAQIGDIYGVSRQRIHQIVGRTSTRSQASTRNPAKPDSSTGKAMESEAYIASVLESHGIKCTLQPSGAKFDILANGYRVNVKSRYSPSYNNGYRNWRWNLYGRENCDIIILLAVPIDAIFIIPVDVLPQAKTISIASDDSKWGKYQDRFSLLQTPNKTYYELGEIMAEEERKDPRIPKTYYLRKSITAVVEAEAKRLDISASEALRKIITEWAAAHETQTPR